MIWPSRVPMALRVGFVVSQPYLGSAIDGNHSGIIIVVQCVWTTLGATLRRGDNTPLESLVIFGLLWAQLLQNLGNDNGFAARQWEHKATEPGAGSRSNRSYVKAGFSYLKQVIMQNVRGDVIIPNFCIRWSPPRRFHQSQKSLLKLEEQLLTGEE